MIDKETGKVYLVFRGQEEAEEFYNDFVDMNDALRYAYVECITEIEV
jgi:hypothetical protein